VFPAAPKKGKETKTRRDTIAPPGRGKVQGDDGKGRGQVMKVNAFSILATQQADQINLVKKSVKKMYQKGRGSTRPPGGRRKQPRREGGLGKGPRSQRKCGSAGVGPRLQSSALPRDKLWTPKKKPHKKGKIQGSQKKMVNGKKKTAFPTWVWPEGENVLRRGGKSPKKKGDPSPKVK